MGTGLGGRHAAHHFAAGHLQVLAVEQIPDLVVADLAGLIVSVILHCTGEFDLQTTRQVDLVLGLQEVGHAALTGLAVDTNDSLVDDRDATDVMWADRADRCFRFANMVRAGTELALGSDAPVSPVDPWGAIRVAVERIGDRRPSWHPEQALTLSPAITASTRHVTQAVTGRPGDVITVAHNPFDLSGDALAGLTSDLTVVGGEVKAAAL